MCIRDRESYGGLQLWMYYEDVLEYALERSKEEAEDGEELARILGKFLDSKGNQIPQ